MGNKKTLLIISAIIVAAVLVVGGFFVYKKYYKAPAPTLAPAVKSTTTPSTQGKCGDGVCDDFEKANPSVCPGDCKAVTQPTTPTTPEGRIIVKQSGGAGLLIAECADKSYITKTADYIIEGTIEKVESKWNKEKTSIFTYTDLKIEKYVKGAPFAEDKLQIVTPGGEVDGIGLAVEDQPIFHEGKKVGIYLQKTNGEFSIVCAQMGVKEIGQAQ